MAASRRCVYTHNSNVYQEKVTDSAQNILTQLLSGVLALSTVYPVQSTPYYLQMGR